MKNCSPCEGLTLERFVQNCLSWVGPHPGAGEKSEEEQAEETMCDELTTTPISCPLVPLEVRRQRIQK